MDVSARICATGPAGTRSWTPLLVMAAWRVAVSSRRAAGPRAGTSFLGWGEMNWSYGKSFAGLVAPRECYGDPRRAAECESGVTVEIVSRLCQQGQLGEAVEALGLLVEGDSVVSQSLFYAVLKRCLVERDLVLGRRVHAITVRGGYESDTFLCNHFLRMYAAHARMQEAMSVFLMVDDPDAFTWSAIISAHVRHGQDKEAVELYRRMRRSGVKADEHVFVAALQACARGGDLETGQQVHADVVASGVDPQLFLGTSLVDMYAKCGSLEDAQRIFDRLVHKDVVTWNAMMAGYSQQGRWQEALRLYRAMLEEEGTDAPDSVTFVCLLQACASVGVPGLETGKQLHAQIRELGLEADGLVGGSLVNMYAKCESLVDARGVFDGLGEKNVVTWSAMIAGYSQQGMGQESLDLYRAMQQEGIVAPDCVTFVCLLHACASVGGSLGLEKGKQLHAQIRERGMQANVFAASSLVNMYAKCGSLEDARVVFDGLSEKNVVTWGAMIAGYSQQGMGQEALALYKVMQDEGVVAADSVTFKCLLQVCANVAALLVGKQLHLQIREQGLHADVLVACSLINMYGKSGSMVDAQQVFEALPERDVAAWNALISGYSREGSSDVVFGLFQRMREDGIQPDDITFLSVLNVCSHAGLVNEGREHFENMRIQYGIRPTVEHYTCMVDLLGRAGRLDEALALVSTMTVLPNAPVWHALLGACQKWGNVEVGRHAFDEAVKLDKKDAPAYVLMSNIYRSAQMWDQAQVMQARRKGICAWKRPGQSWWTDMDGLVHSFLVGDDEHPESQGIYASLIHLFSEIKKRVYVPHLESLAGDCSAIPSPTLEPQNDHTLMHTIAHQCTASF